MPTSVLLPGISQRRCRTARLETAYLEAGSGESTLILIHGNCSSSLFFQDLMLALAALGYHVYAPDMRGYGDSQALPIDATRGVRDLSDDLASFAEALGLSDFHLLGWSLGGNVAMQYAIDYPGRLHSLILEATGSPFGFGGTRDVAGRPVWPDFAGSGGGTANADFVQRLAAGDRSAEQGSPRAVMNNFYFKPPFRVTPEREEIYVSAILSTRTGSGNYPGDSVPSPNWPYVAPGRQGVNNALSPAYLKQEALTDLSPKPPILWIHGADDRIVSDASLFDLGYLGQLGIVPGWPGPDQYPPQPMKAQIRHILERYRQRGGVYHELLLNDCGHSPHIEKPQQVLEAMRDFMAAHS
ncbi:alpha/beta fold hydrolase [Thermogemmatispora sp.]|uniref:alpha/beta fold hydrolase n=1 Tax=Thermogemmatispora sp. TaxID=1968838 RepID=UPI001D6796A2|nr:alpha/beta hydrolase [Thermogemmatispora sp.]MBX5448991.1 alpha/beta hydrolase [Thermogemmatispora sp.]